MFLYEVNISPKEPMFKRDSTSYERHYTDYFIVPQIQPIRSILCMNQSDNFEEYFFSILYLSFTLQHIFQPHEHFSINLVPNILSRQNQVVQAILSNKFRHIRA